MADAEGEGTVYGTTGYILFRGSSLQVKSNTSGHGKEVGVGVVELS